MKEGARGYAGNYMLEDLRWVILHRNAKTPSLSAPPPFSAAPKSNVEGRHDIAYPSKRAEVLESSTESICSLRV